MTEYNDLEDEYEDEKFEGFCFEEDEISLDDIPIDEMTEEQLGIWLDTQPSYYRWATYVGKMLGHLTNIKYIISDFFIILFYKFICTSFYRYIHIGTMIVGVALYWFIMLGQEDVQVLDGEDEHIIFHLPSI